MERQPHATATQIELSSTLILWKFSFFNAHASWTVVMNMHRPTFPSRTFAFSRRQNCRHHSFIQDDRWVRVEGGCCYKTKATFPCGRSVGNLWRNISDWAMVEFWAITRISSTRKRCWRLRWHRNRMKTAPKNVPIRTAAAGWRWRRRQ